MRQPKKVMIVDPGSHSFKCAVLNLKKSTIATWSRESVIAEVNGMCDRYVRMSCETVWDCPLYIGPAIIGSLGSSENCLKQ